MNQPIKEIDTMTREELERELQTARDEQDELDEMRQAVLGQTGVHIGVVLLHTYRARFDRDQKRIDDHMSRIRARLDTLDTH